MNKNWQKFDNLMIDNKDILNSINVKQKQKKIKCKNLLCKPSEESKHDCNGWVRLKVEWRGRPVWRLELGSRRPVANIAWWFLKCFTFCWVSGFQGTHQNVMLHSSVTISQPSREFSPMSVFQTHPPFFLTGYIPLDAFIHTSHRFMSLSWTPFSLLLDPENFCLFFKIH